MAALERQRTSRWGGDKETKMSQEEWGYAYGPVPDWFTLPPVDDEMKQRYGPDVEWTMNGDAEIVRKRLWRRRSKKHQHELKFRHPGPQWRMRHRENYHKGLLNHFVFGGVTQKFRPYEHLYAARFRMEHGYPGNPVKYGYAMKPAPRYVARNEGTWAPNPHWTLPPDRESREYYAMLDAEHVRHEPRDGPNGRKYAPYDPRLTYEERAKKDAEEGIWRAPLVTIRANRTWAPAAVLRNLGPVRDYDHPFWHYHPWALEKRRNVEMVTRADLRALGYKNDAEFDPASERNHFYVPFNESRYSYKSFRRRAAEKRRKRDEYERTSWWGYARRLLRKYLNPKGGDMVGLINNMLGPPKYSNYSATRLSRLKSDNYYGALDPSNKTAVAQFTQQHGDTAVIGRKYPFKRNFMSDDVLQWKREGIDDDHFDIEDDEDDPDLDDEYRDNYLGVPHLDKARRQVQRPKGWDPLVHWFTGVLHDNSEHQPHRAGYLSHNSHIYSVHHHIPVHYQHQIPAPPPYAKSTTRTISSLALLHTFRKGDYHSVDRDVGYHRQRAATVVSYQHIILMIASVTATFVLVQVSISNSRKNHNRVEACKSENCPMVRTRNHHIWL